MADVLTALADPHRRQILDLLLAAPQPVGALVAATGLSQPGVSKHLRALREAGLVDVRPDRQQRIYELRPEPFEELDAWLAPYRSARAADAGHALQRYLDRRD
jgi:DNA-binding transcriptional ArsR family regulator